MAADFNPRSFLDEPVLLPVGSGYETTWRSVVVGSIASLALILAAIGDTIGLPDAELGGLYIFIPFYVALTYRGRVYMPVAAISAICYLVTQMEIIAHSGWSRQSIIAAAINSLVQVTAAGTTVALLEQIRIVTDSASTDFLTKLKNRRGLDEAAPAFLAGARARRSAVTAIVVDINQFKLVNDTFGHDAGDRVLRAVGTALSRVRRRHTYTVRMGGDEFLILSCVRDDREATALKTFVRRCVQEELAKTDIPAAASFGMAIIRQTPETLTTLLAEADAQMYRAKSEARAAALFSREPAKKR